MSRFLVLVVLGVIHLSASIAVAGTSLDGLVSEQVIKPLAEEVSGVAAKRNLDRITLYHRMRASAPFRESAEFIRQQLLNYGLENTRILEYPADGTTMYGTQKSRFAWDVEFAELWELKQQDGVWRRERRLADWDAMPLSLAQDSLAGEVEADLVDIGAGTSASDYLGKNLAGKLVLTSSQPESVANVAVGQHGAAGIISFAANQKTAWWKEDDRLVRWGHLDSFPRVATFAFMISLGEARRLQARLAQGEQVRFHALVRAAQRAGQYTLVDAAIPGTDPAVEHQEIIFTCHLDHPRPGANDNASGCAAILEVARTLHTLVIHGLLPAPRRTLRFIWAPEIEGSLVYLSRRQDTENILANIHLDMVGGGPQTKAVFRVSGGPMSLPGFSADLAHEIGRFVNHQTEQFASGMAVPYPLISAEGGKEPLMALMEGISLGSDHQVFNEGSWRIPGFYLHDWPDRYIHTNFDQAANIDPTKLKRSAFIAALGGWTLANLGPQDAAGLLALLKRNALSRAAEALDRSRHWSSEDAAVARQVYAEVEIRKLHSLAAFMAIEADVVAERQRFIGQLYELAGDSSAEVTAGSGVMYRRNPEIQGPMNAFGYGYLEAHLPADKLSGLRLPDWANTRFDNGEFAYEALNLVDGVRSVSRIRDWLTAELEPVPVEVVAEYLEALESIGVLQR